MNPAFTIVGNQARDLAEAADLHPGDAGAFTFSPTADRHTLIRRIYLSLLGIPPGPDGCHSVSC